MRSLFFVSIILVILSGCASVKPKDLSPVEDISPPVYHVDFEKVLFKATMEIKGNLLTGLLFIKRMPESTYRIVFSNEFGMTYFDLEIRTNDFNVIYCFEPLNKKMVLSLFESDFRLLLDAISTVKGKWFVQKHSNHKVYFTRNGARKTWNNFSANSDTLVSQTAFSSFFDRTIINYQAYQDGFPSKIQIQNPFLDLRLKLSLINK